MPEARLGRGFGARQARLLCACTLRIADQRRFNRPLPYRPFASVVTILTRLCGDRRHPCIFVEWVQTWKPPLNIGVFWGSEILRASYAQN